MLRSMNPTKNSLPQKVRFQVVGVLQEHLANSIDLAGQCKQAHWNVKGHDFISLHELFDRVASHTQAHVDLLAERIVQLGGMADGNLQSCSARTNLPAYPRNATAGEEHTAALAHSLASYGERIRQAVSDTNELSDFATADLLTRILCAADQDLWMVESHHALPVSASLQATG